MARPAELARPAAPGAWYAFAILISAVLLAYVDRQIIALLVDPIRMALRLSDTQIGLIQGPAFTLFYAGAALPLGWLVDRTNRKVILVVSVVLWSVATASCAFAGDFTALLVSRIGVGLGEASLVPAIFSLLGDYFAPQRKAFVFAIYMAAVLVGSTLAMGLGGAVIGAMEQAHVRFGSLHDVWRIAFLAVAVPGPFAALALLGLREPARSEAPREGESATQTDIAAAIFPLLGLAGASTIFQTAMAWMPAVLIRTYHWSAALTGLAVGASATIAAVVAALTAALLGRRAPVHRLMAVALACACAAIPISLSVLAPSAPIVLLGTGALLAPVLTAYALAPLILQGLAGARVWGRLAASFKLAESLGISLSAPAIGYLSDYVFGSHGLARAAAAVLTGTAVATALLLAAGFPKTFKIRKNVDF